MNGKKWELENESYWKYFRHKTHIFNIFNIQCECVNQVCVFSLTHPSIHTILLTSPSHCFILSNHTFPLSSISKSNLTLSTQQQCVFWVCFFMNKLEMHFTHKHSSFFNLSHPILNSLLIPFSINTNTHTPSRICSINTHKSFIPHPYTVFLFLSVFVNHITPSIFTTNWALPSFHHQTIHLISIIPLLLSSPQLIQFHTFLNSFSLSLSHQNNRTTIFSTIFT